FRYGSSFCMVTERPRARRRCPRLDAVNPLPREEATPPVTKICFVVSDDRESRVLLRCTTGFHPITILLPSIHTHCSARVREALVCFEVYPATLKIRASSIRWR